MRYIVIAVESNEVADDMLEEVLPRYLPSGTDVVGMFQVPTKYCNPSDGHRGKRTDSAFTRGKKYGWWVCGACKKPTKAWSSNLNAVLSSSRNLLEQTGILGAAQAITGTTAVSADASSPQEASSPTTTVGTENVETTESANSTAK